MNESKVTAISGKSKIEMAQLYVIRAGLKLELSGMRHSSNAVFLRAQQLTGEKTRKECLAKIEKQIKEKEAELNVNR